MLSWKYPTIRFLRRIALPHSKIVSLHFEKVYDINFHCEKIKFWGFVDCKPRIPLLNILSLFEAIRSCTRLLALCDEGPERRSVVPNLGPDM